MIKKMNDGQAFWEEIASRLSRGEKTNFFFSEKDVHQLVQRGKVCRFDFDGGVYFFVEEDRLYRLYYFLEKEKSPGVLPELQQPIILEEVLLASKERVPSEDSWTRVGLVPYLERQRMYLMAPNIIFEERQLTFASQEMLEDIFSMMNQSFEPFTSMLPTKEELLHDIQGQKIIVTTKNEEILGFLHFGDEKQGCMLWHIAVSPKARGLGVGEGLLKDWFFARKGLTKKYMLWVRRDNPAALGLYEKFGFLPDGRIAPVMIKTT